MSQKTHRTSDLYYAAYLLAKTGHTVSIYEKKATVGLPVQCTGILTADFEQFNLPLDSFFTVMGTFLYPVVAEMAGK